MSEVRNGQDFGQGIFHIDAAFMFLLLENELKIFFCSSRGHKRPVKLCVLYSDRVAPPCRCTTYKY